MVKKIAFIGKFTKYHDEEYIAQAFESLGHTVLRIEQRHTPDTVIQAVEKFQPEILLFTKYEIHPLLYQTLRKYNIKTVCWLFDLYFNYTRENFVRTKQYFKADYVATTDGGNQHRFVNEGINHTCIRQGIAKDECVLLPFEDIKHEIVFVGSDNPVYPERSKLVRELGATWLGKHNTDEARGMALNALYASTRVVIGDSYYSPHYWSNRVVETLGRGGFLIHRDVPGLKEEYPDLVTYDGTIEDLRAKIEYYKDHEEERRDIIIKNFNHVKDKYTMDKKCQELILWINQ